MITVNPPPQASDFEMRDLDGFLPVRSQQIFLAEGSLINPEAAWTGDFLG